MALPPWHTPALSQQPAQLLELQEPPHTPPLHASEPEHALQTAPPLPQALGAVPGRHTPAWQQPAEQLLP